jgi:hypothetical protein
MIYRLSAPTPWAVALLTAGRLLAGVCLGGLLAAFGAGPALAATGGQVSSASGIFSCVDAGGKRHTSDRPIPECLDREQRVLNKDGSQKQTLPPRMNAEERAEMEERQRLRERAQAAAKDAVRRDRNLMLRYPDAATHDKAREAALDDVRRGIANTERLLKALQDERKPLVTETEFYKGKRLPGKLRSKMEANEAQQQAQLDIIQNQKAEMARVNGLYDAELARLKRLWAGEMPGTTPVAQTPSKVR